MERSLFRFGAIECRECSTPLNIVAKKLQIYWRYCCVVDKFFYELVVIDHIKGPAHVNRYCDCPLGGPFLVKAFGNGISDELKSSGCGMHTFISMLVADVWDVGLYACKDYSFECFG